MLVSWCFHEENGSFCGLASAPPYGAFTTTSVSIGCYICLCLTQFLSSSTLFLTTKLDFKTLVYYSPIRYTFIPNEPLLKSIRTMAMPQTGSQVASNSLRLGSITSFHFILLTINWTWQDKTMECSMLWSQVRFLPVSSWRHPETKATIVTFHDLPKEIIFAIFEHTLLDALMKLRQTNSCAKYVIESWLPFRQLVNMDLTFFEWP